MQVYFRYLLILIIWLFGNVSIVNASALQHFQRGINLGHWFSQNNMQGDAYIAHVNSYITDRDMRLIREAGFDHVRIMIAQKALFPDSKEIADEHVLNALQSAIAKLHAHGLAVILSLYLDRPTKQALAYDYIAVAHTLAMQWQQLCYAVKYFSPSHLLLEVLNEPAIVEYTDGSNQAYYNWDKAQPIILQAMRDAAPEHTLLATGADWAELEGLQQLKLPKINNVVYYIHFYTPFLYTHQGAEWHREMNAIKHVPYPSNKKICSYRPYADLQYTHAMMKEYCAENWNKERLRREVQKIDTWARTHGVEIIINEFGVYPKHRPDRLEYIRDVRTLFEAYNLPWTIWNYTRGFGVTTEKNGQRTLNPQIIEVLGLKK